MRELVGKEPVCHLWMVLHAQGLSPETDCWGARLHELGVLRHALTAELGWPHVLAWHPAQDWTWPEVFELLRVARTVLRLRQVVEVHIGHPGHRGWDESAAAVLAELIGARGARP